MNEDSIKGHHYPTPKQLQNILKPDTSGLAVRWYDLGTQLLTVDTVGVLDVIKANHPNDTSACCNKMFIMWLELQPSATWSQLVFALTNIGMNLAAENVIKYLVKGESTNSVKNAKGTGLQSYNVMAITPAQASGEFGVLLAKIIKELSQNNEAENLESLKLLCSILSVKNDPSTLFFNKEQQEAINACNKVGTLLTKHLRHCWRWDDVSFLKRVFMSLETDQFERCFEMISQYEMKIFIKLKLKEIGEYCRQKNIVPPEGYHKMATIVANKSFCHITLEEYKQLKEFILQHCKAEPYNKVLIDTKYLNKAKKDKKVVDFKHIKVLLTGSSAAGKSSFCRLLFRLKFIPEYDSTDIVEKKQAVPVIKSRSEYENQAVAVKSLSMLKQGKEVVWLELDLKDQIRYLKSLLESDKFHDQKTPPHTPNDENYTAIGSSDDNVDKNDSNDNNDKSFIKIPQSDIDKKIIASEALSDSYTIETVKLITVVDTGGQPEYVHLLPAINSYPTITFLVHDLTKKLDDPVQVRYKKTGCEEDPEKILNYSNLDMIHLLMSFVRDSLSIEHQSEVMVPNISVPQKPYIGFVGTHYDQIKGDEVTDINKELELIVNEKNFKGVGILAPEKGIIYPVNNTTAGDSEKEDPHGKIIREQIEHFTNEIEAKILPITWMILQLTLQDLCVTHHKKYITYGEYMEIAKKSVSICDEEEINATLIYFHFIGLLLYFQNPSLCDYIIINLQWLYTNLAKVMRLSLKDVKIDDRTLRKKFDEKRLLPSKQSDCEIKLEDVSQQELECFFKILMHLKVIAIVTIDDKDFYYLPCVLSNLRMYDDKHKHLLSEPLLVQFTSGFLPRGFFCSLVVHLLNDQPEKWEHQLHRSAKNFSDLMIFRLPDKTYLYLHDKIFYLKVEVRHERKYVDAWYHFELFDVLQKYLIRVCKQLNFDHHKLQYGFLCLANENDGDHIAVIDLPEIIRNKCTRVCSRECSNVTELDESHTIWFEKIKKRNQSDDSAGTKKQDSILETRSIDQLANVSTERLLLCSSSGSETEIDVLSIKPEMWAIIKIVFPKIKAKWQYVAYFMKYTPLEVKAFKNDSNDLEGSCLNLFTDWLTTNHGITPKTWQILIDKIKIVDGLQNAAENIEEEVKTLNM